LLIRKASDLHLVQKFVQQNEFLSYDLETTGLNPRKNQVMGIAITNDIEGYYLVLRSYENEVLKDVLTLSDILPVLDLLKTKKLYMWNASFDCRFTQSQMNVDLTQALYSDGMLAKHTVIEDAYTYALKPTAAELYGDDATEEQKLMKESIKANGGSATEFYKADTEILGKYGIKDGLLTYKINEHYIAQIEAEGLTKFFFEDEVMPLYKNVTIPMEANGIPLDLEKMRAAKKEIRTDIEQLETKIQELIKPHCYKFEAWYLNYHYPVKTTGPFVQKLIEITNTELPKLASGKYSTAAKHIEGLCSTNTVRRFLSGDRLHEDLVQQVRTQLHGNAPMLNLSSKHHLKKIFFDTLKLEPISRTDKGNPQADEKFLESIKDQYDFVPLLIEYNKLSKIEGTYIDRFLEAEENGMFYPSFFQHRTTSGRYGSDLQQLPRPLEQEDEPSALVRHHNNKVREFFIAGNGQKFLDADYNSLEVVVFADDAGDEALLDVIRTGKDFYSQVAIEVHGLQSDFSADKKAHNFLKNAKPKLRQDAKAYALGCRYGLGAWKLSKDLNISQNEADAIVKRYFTNFPGLKRAMDNYERQAKLQGFVTSKAGRKRHLNRVKELYDKYSDDLADSLELWKKYHEVPSQYARMKELRREYNNLINNALNFPIQSFATSIVNQSAIKLAAYIRNNAIRAYICAQIHDQLVVRCHEDDVAVLQPAMKQIMENTFQLSAPLTANPEISNNLREGH